MSTYHLCFIGALNGDFYAEQLKRPGENATLVAYDRLRNREWEKRFDADQYSLRVETDENDIVTAIVRPDGLSTRSAVYDGRTIAPGLPLHDPRRLLEQDEVISIPVFRLQQSIEGYGMKKFWFRAIGKDLSFIPGYVNVAISSGVDLYEESPFGWAFEESFSKEPQGIVMNKDEVLKEFYW